MGREVGHHRAEGGRECAHVSRYRAAARSRTFRRRLVGEAPECHVGEPLLRSLRVLKHVFHHLFAGIEGGELVETHAADGDADYLFFGKPERALLEAKIVAAGLKESAFGDEPHDFSAGHADAAGRRRARHFVECRVERRLRYVSDVHRHLCDAVFVDIPPDGFRALERPRDGDYIAVLVLERFAVGLAALAFGASLLAHVEGYRVGAARARGVEVVVHGYEEVAGADSRRSSAGYSLVEGTVAEIRSAGFFPEAFGQALILALAAHGKIFTLGRKGRRLVGINGDAEFVGDAGSEAAGKLGTFFERDAGHGYQREHIGGAHARMRPVVLAHINKFRSLAHGPEGGFDHGLGLAHESHHRAVGGLARVNVEKAHAFAVSDCIGNGFNHCLVAPFAEIGHTFDDSFFHGSLLRGLGGVGGGVSAPEDNAVAVQQIEEAKLVAYRRGIDPAVGGIHPVVVVGIAFFKRALHAFERLVRLVGLRIETGRMVVDGAVSVVDGVDDVAYPLKRFLALAELQKGEAPERADVVDVEIVHVRHLLEHLPGG